MIFSMKYTRHKKMNHPRAYTHTYTTFTLRRVRNFPTSCDELETQTQAQNPKENPSNTGRRKVHQCVDHVILGRFNEGVLVGDLFFFMEVGERDGRELQWRSRERERVLVGFGRKKGVLLSKKISQHFFKNTPH